jgi:hypothetical protein
VSAGLDPFEALDLAGCFLWAVTYVLVIRRGSLDRASGAPLLALASTIAWELIYTVVRSTPRLPGFVVPAWLVIDAAILYQYLRYGPARRRRTAKAAPARFYAKVAAAVAVAFALEYSVILDHADRDGVYSGFAVNVVVSLAFVAMIERRRDVRGQSMYIALAKLVGSAIMIPHAYALHGSLWSLRAFMGATLLGDVVYAALLHRQFWAQGIRPWERL